MLSAILKAIERKYKDGVRSSTAAPLGALITWLFGSGRCVCQCGPATRDTPDHSQPVLMLVLVCSRPAQSNTCPARIHPKDTTSFKHTVPIQKAGVRTEDYRVFHPISERVGMLLAEHLNFQMFIFFF